MKFSSTLLLLLILTALARPGLADTTPPTVPAMYLDPTTGTTGTGVVLWFDSSEQLNANPVVSVAGHPFTLGWHDGLVTYRYDRTLSGNEPAGAQPINVQLTDLAGNTNSVTVGSLTVDYTQPTVPAVYLNPTTGTTGTAIVLWFDSSEKLGANPVVSVAGHQFTLGWYNGDRTYRFDRTLTGSEPAGAQSINVQMTDLAGNTNSVTVGSLTVDYTRPTVPAVFLDPTTGTTGTGVVLWFDSSEKLSANPVVSVAGHPFTLGWHDGVRTYRYDRTLSGNEPAGAQPINVQMTDLAGNTNTVTAGSLTVDYTRPTAPAVFLDPTTGTTGTGVVLWFDSSEKLSANPAVSVAGHPFTLGWHDGVQTYRYDRTLSGNEPAGVQPINVQMTDLAGNTNSVTAGSLTVDYTRPTVPAVFLEPATGTTGTGIVLWFDSSEKLSANPAVSVAGHPFTLVWHDGVRTYRYDRTLSGSEPAGVQPINVQMSDLAGNTNTVTAESLTIDYTPPTFSPVTARPPVVGLGQTVSVTFTASEMLAATPNVTMSAGAMELFSSGGLSYVFRRTIAETDPLGPTSIFISGSNLAGLVGTDSSASITVVTTPPPVAQIQQSATSVSEGDAVTFTAVGASTTNSTLWSFSGGSTSSNVSTTHVFSDGPSVQSITLNITDTFGQAASASTTVEVLNVTPTVELQPLPPRVTGTTTLHWTSADPGAAENLRFSIFATDLHAAAGSQPTTLAQNLVDTSSFQWNTANEPDSLYQLSLKVIDKDGGTGGSSSAPTIVDNHTPLVTPTAISPATFDPRTEQTVFSYSLSESASTRIEIARSSPFSIISTIQTDTTTRSGLHSIQWNGRSSESGNILPDGDYAFVVVARDDAGNTASTNSASSGLKASLRSGIAPPTVTPTPISPTRNTTLTLAGTKPTATGVEISGGASGIVTVPINTFTTWQSTAALNEGQNTFILRTFNAAGERSYNISTIVSLKTTPPPPVEIDPVVSPAASPSQIITGRKAPDTSVLLDGLERVTRTPSTTWSVPVNYFAGTTVYSFTAKDQVGNVSAPTTVAVSLEPNLVTTPTLNQLPSVTNQTPIILSGTRQSNTELEIVAQKLNPPGNGGSWSVPAGTSTTWAISVTLGEGAQRIQIQAFDAIRSASGVASTTLTVDTTPPSLQISGVNQGATVLESNPPIFVTYTDPSPGTGVITSTLVIDVDGTAVNGAAIQAGTATLPPLGLVPGNHTITARVKDAAGNFGTTLLSFTTISPPANGAPVVTHVAKPVNRFAPAYNPYTPIHESEFAIQFSMSQAVTPHLHIETAAHATVLTTDLPPTAANQPAEARWNGRTVEGDLVDTGDYVIRITGTTSTGLTTSLPETMVRVHH